MPKVQELNICASIEQSLEQEVLAAPGSVVYERGLVHASRVDMELARIQGFLYEGRGARMRKVASEREELGMYAVSRSNRRKSIYSSYFNDVCNHRTDILRRYGQNA